MALMPNIENMPTWACFRCSAASSPHPLMLDMKNCSGDVFFVSGGSPTIALTPNMENTPTWACFRCLAASSPHSLTLDPKNMPPRRVLHVRRLPDHTPHAEPRKHTHMGVFSMFGCFFTTPPHTGHEKRAPKGVFFIAMRQGGGILNLFINIVVVI